MSHDHHRLLGAVQGIEHRPDALLVSGRGIVKRKLRSGCRVPERLELFRAASQQDASCQAPCSRPNVATGVV